jgi:hypothetical protein
LCLVPDVPEGKLDMGVLKPMCEQAGTKVTSRGCGGNPNRSSPGFQMVFFGNFCPDVINLDDGAHRRFNVFELAARFTPFPNEGELQADPELKPMIKTGIMNVGFFHAVRFWADSLQLFTTSIYRSPNADAVTKLALLSDTKGGVPVDHFAVWVVANIEPCSIAEVSTEAEVKARFRTYFTNLRLADARARVTEKGFVFKSQGQRYVQYKFEGAAAIAPVKLKPLPA